MPALGGVGADAGHAHAGAVTREVPGPADAQPLAGEAITALVGGGDLPILARDRIPGRAHAEGVVGVDADIDDQLRAGEITEQAVVAHVVSYRAREAPSLRVAGGGVDHDQIASGGVAAQHQVWAEGGIGQLIPLSHVDAGRGIDERVPTQNGSRGGRCVDLAAMAGDDLGLPDADGHQDDGGGAEEDAPPKC